MKQETLRLIHNEAMICADCIRECGPYKKFEWRLWGYLVCLWDMGYIDFEQKDKIEQHYRKYFKELKSSLN